MEQVKAAKAAVPDISVEAAAKLLGKDNVLFVDVRDGDEVAQTGKVAGALNVSRGMLEFRADETSPMHNPEFSRGKTVVLYCASGGRSALAGKTLQELGFTDVHNLGGFKAWAEGGQPVDR